MTKDFDALTHRLIAFRDDRDWKQFHGLRNLMISLNLEAAELLELGQWLNDGALEKKLDDPAFVERLAEESADVLLYLLLICERAGIDLTEAAHRKIDANGRKYPAEKSRGNARKYHDL
ncbi:MAG: nucleotide pyrophosphohydrolase [Rhodospirillales bacterium]|nr:nucleotide pyrophosphohydrolase [Rhodospirillales bacterium]MCW8951485.1 nucleotide pyrophosphohydrolase [Rhodospirillales bacterium]MCW8970460.1 nucleotide pyrophosphohydrolase [Rhodospirillales bacterium]MCW9039961.1 nucleotide pyrophosphohydrolase [Rhodospirillales bacterium]